MKIRLWKRCPCIGCLVDPTCTQPCKDYSDFIGPVKKKVNACTIFFAWVDKLLEAVTEGLPRARKITDFLFEKLGTILMLPLMWCLIRFVWGMKLPFDQDKAKGDIHEMRYSVWERQQQ